MSFVVYKSSAGSGKTFALVKEYLKLVLKDEQAPPQKYRRILAVTFTNKAAAEMKERVMKALKELSDNKNPLLTDVLKEETGLDAETISRRAGICLSGILHNYSDFSISTIDSFVHKIVRSFAFDLDIPMDFEIEMDGEKLLSRAIDELINKIGADDRLTKALIEFAESKAEEERSWHIENDLQAFASALLNENGIPYIEKLKHLTPDDFFQIRSVLNKEIATFETAVKEMAGRGFQLIKDHKISISSFYQGDKGIGSYFKNLSEERFEKIIPNSYVFDAIRKDKWTGSKASKDDVSAIERISTELAGYFNAIQDKSEGELRNYILFKQLRRNIYALAVLNEIEKIVVGIKKENNILHISEFNKIISGIVFDQPAPFIYERIGERYEHYLVDEFQDTSVLQWQNLVPLMDNSLSYGNFNMIVGDGKQAIYRWRGGEVEQFTRLPEIKNESGNELVRERERSLKSHFQERQLNKNYRSQPGIIEFNNEFFLYASSQLSEANKPIYRNFRQEPGKNGKKGYVSLEFLEEPEDNDAGETVCRKVFEIIQQSITGGYQLNEITILTRNNKEGNLITTCLAKKGIHVVSSESLLLKNSPAVNFIVSVLSYLLNTEDAIAKTSIITYLLESERIKRDSLNDAIAANAHGHFTTFLSDHGFVLPAFTLLKMPLYDLCEELTRIFVLNKNTDPYLLFFLDKVFGYSSRINNNIADFMEWWKTQKEKSSITISAGADAVNVMTIHKSKGLEFPVVIIPFANWANTQNDEKIWINIDHEKLPELKSSLVNLSVEIQQTDYADRYTEEKGKQALDNLNLLYVALTRPVDRLHIIATKPKGTKTTSKLFVDFLKASGEWEDNKLFYEFGIKGSNTGKHAGTGKVRELDKVFSSDWRARVAIRTSRPEPDEITGKDRGIVIHELFSRIKTESDVEMAVNQLFYKGSINDEERKLFIPKVKRIISAPLLSNYFRKGLSLKLESEIVLPGGQMYRPDRVVLENDRAVIIDYKTGRESGKHKEQLIQYESVLKKMGFARVDKFLVYFEEEKVEKV